MRRMQTELRRCWTRSSCPKNASAHEAAVWDARRLGALLSRVERFGHRLTARTRRAVRPWSWKEEHPRKAGVVLLGA